MMDTFVQPMQAPSDHELRAQLRKARIDNLILEKKLAHANKQIEQYKLSAALLQEMSADPSCP
jgi:hypothetical protein